MKNTISISAKYIAVNHNKILKDCELTIDKNGLIIRFEQISNPEKNSDCYYNGILCPGFINTHCHLELAYLHNKLPTKTTLPDFIKNIVYEKRNIKREEVQRIIKNADRKMQENGIVAVGDISNDISSLLVKSTSDLYYHTFIELFGLVQHPSDEVKENALSIQESFKDKHLPASITPHAPYSVSPNLLKWIIGEHNNDQLFTIHNQETASENDLFQSKSGSVKDAMEELGANIDYWQPTGQNSIQSTLNYFKKHHKLLLVHNTFTSKEDIDYATSNFENLWWCFCPNANLYIENKLPSIPLFLDHSNRITLGTDSLASNNELSILSEMKTIQKHYPETSLEQLLQWATINGAKFLGIDDQFGSLEVGKRPGLVLIENTDGLKLTDQSTARRIT